VGGFFSFKNVAYIANYLHPAWLEGQHHAPGLEGGMGKGLQQEPHSLAFAGTAA